MVINNGGQEGYELRGPSNIKGKVIKFYDQVDNHSHHDKEMGKCMIKSIKTSEIEHRPIK